MSDFPSIAVLEVTGKCQLACPICRTESSPDQTHRTLAQIEAMLDGVIKNQPEPRALQIAGGEPTIHPQIDEILQRAKSLPIAHLMLSTNGIRISQDDEFAKRLLDCMPGFEVHLQFDSLRPSCLRDLRGEDLSTIRRRGLDRLNKLNLPTMLVVNLKKGQNDDEIGEIIEFAIKQRCVNGVILRPIQPSTLAEVQEQIIEQSSHFSAADKIPIVFDSILVAQLRGTHDAKTLRNPDLLFLDADNHIGMKCR